MIGDGAGGATLTWQDSRSGTNYNIYAQRMSAAGIPQWIANGAEVCFETDDQLYPTIASDGGTGAIITWFDARNHPSGDDIYASAHRGSGGSATVDPNGVPLCTAAKQPRISTIAADGGRRAFVTWQDHRGADYDIYLHRIDPAGGDPVGSGPVRPFRWPRRAAHGRIHFSRPSADGVRAAGSGSGSYGGPSMSAAAGCEVSGTTPLTAGTHVLAWDSRTSDGRGAANGMYFLRQGPRVRGVAVGGPVEVTHRSAGRDSGSPRVRPSRDRRRGRVSTPSHGPSLRQIPSDRGGV